MSENLLIKEGQIGRKFSPVDRLRVNNQGGGSSLWRNYEELEIDDLSVSENGLYQALDDGLYAYDVVTVDVQELSENEKNTGKKITGKDTDLGDDVAVGVDEDGNLTEERIPDAIEITVPPTRKKYVVGDTINFAGIVVYLKYSGGIFASDDYPTGEIPFDELIFPVTTVDDSQTPTVTDTAEVHYTANRFENREHLTRWTVSEGSALCAGEVKDLPLDVPLSDSVGGLKCVFASTNPFKIEKLTYSTTGGTQKEQLSSKTGTYNGVTFSYRYIVHVVNVMLFGADGDNFFAYPSACGVVAYDDFTEEASLEVAYLLATGQLSPSKAEIPVQWMRPEDGEILEDTFEIEIVPEKIPEPEPQPEPDPYSDHYDFEYQGQKYNFNRSDIRQMSYSSGYVLVMYMDTMQTYTVADALKYNLIVRVGSTHTGGDF